MPYPWRHKLSRVYQESFLLRILLTPLPKKTTTVDGLKSLQREELMMCPTERAVAANLFFSFGTVGEDGEVTLQPCDLRRMLQSMGVVSLFMFSKKKKRVINT